MISGFVTEHGSGFPADEGGSEIVLLYSIKQYFIVSNRRKYSPEALQCATA